MFDRGDRENEINKSAEMKKYQIIVIDPPWPISKLKRRIRPNQVNMEYLMMSIEDIKNLDIENIADDKSIIFCWTISGFLFETKDIIENWGFKYHLTMAWDKTNGIALYGFTRQTEFIVVGLRGKHEMFPKRSTIRTSFTTKSPFHSAKPDEFYQMLDVLDGERIDIFARRGRNTLMGKSWDVWGNEVKSNIELTQKKWGRNIST